MVKGKPLMDITVLSDVLTVMKRRSLFKYKGIELTFFLN